MADYLARLAERTLGMAPVVQPLIAPVFTPEPASHPPGLEQDMEAPASSGDPLYRAKSPLPAVGTPPAGDTLEEVSRDPAVSERDEQDASITSPHPGASDVSPEPYHPAGSGTSKGKLVEAQLLVRDHAYHPAGSGTSEGGITSAREDQSTIVPNAPNLPRRMRNAAGTDLLEGKNVLGREDRRNSSSSVPESLPRTPGSRSGPSRPGELGSSDREVRRMVTSRLDSSSHPGESGSSDREIVPGKEGQRHPSQATARNHQTPPETRQRTEPVPTPPSWDGTGGRSEAAANAQEQEERSNVASNMPEHSQRISDEPQLLHAAGSNSTRRGVNTVSPRLVASENVPPGSSLAEGGSEQDESHSVRALSGPARGTTLPPGPSPNTRAAPDADGSAPGSEANPDRPRSPDVSLPVMPVTARPRSNGHPEWGLQEPRVDAPESSAPGIRVTIGRIEVRAIAPPPARRTEPARSGPALSLDDYLKQRAGGR